MMKAARWHGQRDIRIDTIDRPTPKQGQVLVDVEWAGICGSDLHEYLDGPIAIPSADGEPHPISGGKAPATMGHEFCGRISYVPGSTATTLKVGDPVMVDPRLYCGSCPKCTAGDTNACPQWGFHGLSGCCGGFAETVAVSATMCHLLPDQEGCLEYAALIEPLTVAWHAVKLCKRADFRDARILIIGGGPIGIALTLVLRVWGAETVFVSEPTEARRAQVQVLAHRVFDPREVNVGEKCRGLTNGRGVDVVFDAAGTAPGLKDGIDALRYNGTYISVAIYDKIFPVPAMLFLVKEPIIRSSNTYNDTDFAETVKAHTEGKFKGAEQMVTSRIGLDDVHEKGFKELVSNMQNHVKILISPKVK